MERQHDHLLRVIDQDETPAAPVVSSQPFFPSKEEDRPPPPEPSVPAEKSARDFSADAFLDDADSGDASDDSLAGLLDDIMQASSKQRETTAAKARAGPTKIVQGRGTSFDPLGYVVRW